MDPGKGVLVDVISPGGEYLDSFFLPLPKGVGLYGLGRYPLTISGRTRPARTRPQATCSAPRLILLLCLAVALASGASSLEKASTGILLPDGREFVSWEQPLQFARTY